MTGHAVLQDRFGRCITYLRLSVTDRCDFRCLYCMTDRAIVEAMAIKPRGHEFDRHAPPKIVRFMNHTGG